MLKLIISLMLLGNSLQASYADYWETLQQDQGHLTISSIWTESNSVKFFITEDQGDHKPIPLMVKHSDVPLIEENQWKPGDLVSFKWFGEEFYYVTNLRTQSTIIAIEPVGSQHYLNPEGPNL